jgi:hypothetical protein
MPHLPVRFGIMLLFAPIAMAQTPAMAPSALDSKAQAVIRSALRVIREADGEVTLSSPGHSFAPKTPFLFFRKRNTRIEPIANAVFVREVVDPKTSQKTIVVQLQRDNIIKYPTPGDYAAPMSEPGDPVAQAKDSNNFRPPITPDAPPEPNRRPGFMEYGMGLMLGTISTTPSGDVNVSKNSKGYRFLSSHFQYDSHYLPIGVEYDSHSGNFPTTTYEGKVIQSSEKVSVLNVGYRFKPIWKERLELSARISFLSEEFTTNNIDVSLINTRTSATGIGIKARLNLKSPVWRPENNGFGVCLQGFGAEFNYYPSVTATDFNVITRGTASTESSALSFRASVTALTYIPFIPLFKRWVLQGSYGARIEQLAFSGTTVGEPSNPEPVPQNGTSKESESDFRFFFGVRIDDPVQTIFSTDR